VGGGWVLSEFEYEPNNA